MVHDKPPGLIRCDSRDVCAAGYSGVDCAACALGRAGPACAEPAEVSADELRAILKATVKSKK